MATTKAAILAGACLAALGGWASQARAQTNPVPFVGLPLAPDTVAPGSGGFTLTVNGANFATSSLVYWNGSPRATTYVSAAQVQAQILASDVASPGSAGVSVVTAAPGGGHSNTTQFEVAYSRTSVSFGQLSVTDTGGSPYFVGVADVVSKNTNLDLIATDSSTNEISIFLGNGNGTFNAPTNYPVGNVPASAATGDLNSDNIADLVVADQDSNEVSVLLGNGDGTFQAAVSYAANDGPKSVVLGDFNGDGILDIAVANSGGSYLASVLLGNGDGTFQAPVSYGTGSAGAWIALGDFNGDGILDLAVAQYSPTGVNILLGNGDGTFGTPAFYATGAGAQSVAVADFNGDGKPDLAVACETASTVDILLGNGDGTFQTAVEYATGQTPFTVAVGDMRGDGFLDLVTANSSGRSASILLGNGNGTFQAHQDYSINGYPFTLAIADLTLDGLPDMVAAINTGTIAILLQTTVVFTPALLAFGDQAVGSSSAAQTITVTNTASQALDVSGVAVDGTDPGDFSQSNTCKAVAPGGTCTISVTFTPQAAGNRGANLNITDNAPNSPQVVLLTGVGAQPAVTLTPASLTFPAQVVSTTSKAQTVTLTNTGNASLTISNIKATGDFSETSNCGASVAPGGKCTIPVTFKPLAKGTLSGTLGVTDNATGSPQTVSLSGAGTYVSLKPASLNLGSEPVGAKSPSQNITLSNRGSTPLGISGITLTGGDPGDFAQKNNCGSGIAAGASCTISVTFKPTAKGTRTADVSVSDNGGGSPQQAALTGTGT